jgi:hypothetical protein
MSLTKRPSAIGEYLLYAGTIFLSAFLLFLVEPIAGKHLLPWFGGSSSVWATSLLFFTAMLFTGYLYVYLLTSLGGKRQAAIHACVVAIVSLMALIALFFWHSIYPPLMWVEGSTQPALDVLIALSIAIGGPYFLLSTTGPLLQYWYGTSAHKEPYKLYALSNAGSFLALLSYPLVIEPFSPLHVQEGVWIIFFFLYVAVSAVIVVKLFRVRHFAQRAPAIEGEARSPIGLRLFWVACAALPSFLLVASTTEITQVIAPVPLLWIIPLSLYLLTFIIAFAGKGRSIFVPVFLLVMAITAYFYTSVSVYLIVWQLASYLALLFFCALMCHARLYRLRPATAELPLFYLLISFGGMLGALCASVIAPLIFPDFWEFPLAIVLAGGFATSLLIDFFFGRILGRTRIIAARIILSLALAVLFTQLIFKDGDFPTLTSRNFYGTTKVEFEGTVTALVHGATLHGLQIDEKGYEFAPTTYYTVNSGLGRAMRFEEQARGAKSLRVGVVGLGTGSIAAYCRPHDTYVFYEIDPRIKILATTYFSYLTHCAGSQVRIGDGRITLSNELRNGTPGSYDLIAVDAFTDDTIPVHLLTAQAAAIYAAHLRSPTSIIAIHTSNRYLDLVPIVFRLASQIGFSATVVRDDGSSTRTGGASVWVLLVKDSSVFRSRIFAGSNTGLPQPGPLWTDDYTSLLSVVNFPLP